MPYYLAIDAGGTKTQCLLADETHILARASTGSVKLMRVSEQEATTRLHTMLAEVAASATVSLANITRTCVGLAGLSIPAVRAWATTAITAKVSGDLILLGDEEIALEAAFAGGPGILVIAGTGSNVIGRAPDGSLHSAGGWGPILGDEGAGYWIGLESIRAALQARDADPPSSLCPEPSASTIPAVLSSTAPETPGAPSIPVSPGWAGCTPSTSLLQEIQHHWNLKSLAELVAFANHRGDADQPAPDFAALAPIVARSADQGNPIAAAILQRAGEALSAQVTLVAQKMGAPSYPTRKLAKSFRSSSGLQPAVSDAEMKGASAPGLPQTMADSAASPEPSSSNPEAKTSNLTIAYTGSVLTQIYPIRIAMITSLANAIPNAQVQPAAVDSLEGALWRARHG